jgi:sulfopyruvate decarboxylase subunit beta
MLTAREIVEDLAANRTEQVVIATMSAGLHWLDVSDHDRDVVYNAPMGSAVSVGLGLALARPDIRVIVLDGDGALLMNLGALVTVAGTRLPNLAHVVFANGGYAITGGQRMPGVAHLDWEALARAVGHERCHTVEESGQWLAVSPLVLEGGGPVFVCATTDITSARPILAEIGNRDPGRKHHTHAGYWRTAKSLSRWPANSMSWQNGTTESGH